MSYCDFNDLPKDWKFPISSGITPVNEHDAIFKVTAIDRKEKSENDDARRIQN